MHSSHHGHTWSHHVRVVHHVGVHHSLLLLLHHHLLLSHPCLLLSHHGLLLGSHWVHCHCLCLSGLSLSLSLGSLSLGHGSSRVWLHHRSSHRSWCWHAWLRSNCWIHHHGWSWCSHHPILEVWIVHCLHSVHHHLLLSLHHGVLVLNNHLMLHHGMVGSVCVGNLCCMLHRVVSCHVVCLSDCVCLCVTLNLLEETLLLNLFLLLSKSVEGFFITIFLCLSNLEFKKSSLPFLDCQWVLFVIVSRESQAEFLVILVLIKSTILINKPVEAGSEWSNNEECRETKSNERNNVDSSILEHVFFDSVASFLFNFFLNFLKN